MGVTNSGKHNTLKIYNCKIFMTRVQEFIFFQRNCFKNEIKKSFFSPMWRLNVCPNDNSSSGFWSTRRLEEFWQPDVSK